MEPSASSGSSGGEVFNGGEVDPIFYPNHSELNAKLYPLLIGWSEKRDDHRLHSNQVTFFRLENSWHSPNDLHEQELFRPLCDFIEERVSSIMNAPLQIFSMWSIIGTNRSQGGRHFHVGSVSGAYYVNNGHEEGENISASIHFHGSGGVKSFEPQDGQILLFPAPLEHHVDAYLGSNRRVVISFNLR